MYRLHNSAHAKEIRLADSLPDVDMFVREHVRGYNKQSNRPNNLVEDHSMTILIQDSVEMRRLFPKHPLWSDPFFGQPDYETFARDMEQALAGQDEEPQHSLAY
jgi:hypothetical protein